MSNAVPTRALELLKTGRLMLGPNLESAHEICQENEGDPVFDWIHALIHRIEGDEANAAYWYRRAGKTRHPGSVTEEWKVIWDEVS